MQKIAISLVMAATVALAGCNSSKNSDSDGDEVTPMANTLDDVISRSADSRPVDDGLDQVNADLLTLFGDANAVPLAIGDDETVVSLVARQRAAR